MATGKVEKVTFVSEWEYQGKKNYNFVVKFEGSNDRYVSVSQDKSNPKFIEGQTQEYEVADKIIKLFAGGQTYEYPKITPPKKSFGGGGGYKEDPNKPHNILVTTCVQEATNFIIARHTMDIDKDFDRVFNQMLKVAEPKIK
jgi:hypothetical protein